MVTWGTPPGIDMAIEERASDLDREWFAVRPHRTWRLRPILAGELAAHHATHIVTRQIQPSVRIRKPVLIVGRSPANNDVELERFIDACAEDGIAHVVDGLVGRRSA